MVILVVDDELAIRDLLIDVLEDEGHTAVGAGNGRQALNYLQQTDVLPDLIIVDTMMPEMDGVSFRRQQLQEPKLAKIPTVLMGAGKIPPVAARLGAAFLAKPVSVEDLLQVASNIYVQRLPGDPTTEAPPPEE